MGRPAARYLIMIPWSSPETPAGGRGKLRQVELNHAIGKDELMEQLPLAVMPRYIFGRLLFPNEALRISNTWRAMAYTCHWTAVTGHY